MLKPHQIEGVKFMVFSFSKLFCKERKLNHFKNKVGILL